MTIQVVVVELAVLFFVAIYSTIGAKQWLDWIELLYNSFLSFTDTAAIDFL